MNQAMFERDLLYPTAKQYEPGSVHITVYQPEKAGDIPILVEAKTVHNPFDYILDIVDLMQADVFDRIRIDIRKSGIFYFKMAENQYCKVKYQDKNTYSSELVQGL